MNVLRIFLLTRFYIKPILPYPKSQKLPYSRKLYGPVPPLPQEDVTSSSGGSSGGKTSGDSSGSGSSAVSKKGTGVVSNEQSNYNKRKLRAKSQEIILEVRIEITYL